MSTKKITRKWLFVISAVGAVVLWFVVNIFINPIGSRVLSGIPVSLGTGERTLDLLGLDLENKDDLGTVSVEISGSRLAISSLTADDFTVTPRLSNVTADGTYLVELLVTLDNQKNDIELVSYSPRSLSLTFVRTVTKQLSLTCTVAGDVPDGYYLSSIVPADENMTVTGPAELVAQVVSASVNVSPTASGTLSALPVHLYDSDGKEIKSDNLKLSVSATDVTVSLLKTKVLTVSTSLSGYPENMAEGMVTLTVPEEYRTFTVAGDEAAIDALATVYNLSVDIDSVIHNETRTVPLSLPSGVASIDGVAEIPLSVHISDDIFFQDVAVSRIELSPALIETDATVTVTTKMLKVRIAGSEDVIAAVTEENLVATVLYDFDQPLQKGQYSLDVAVSFYEMPEKPSYAGYFWVICDSDVIVKVS